MEDEIATYWDWESQVDKFEEVRISSAALMRIKIGDKYLLMRYKSDNPDGSWQYVTIGGALEYLTDQDRKTLEEMGATAFEGDEKRPHEQSLRFTLPVSSLGAFEFWFRKGQGRELDLDALRELEEEMVEELEIFSPEEFAALLKPTDVSTTTFSATEVTPSLTAQINAGDQNVTEPSSEIAKSVTKAITRYRNKEQKAQLLLDFVYTDIEMRLKTEDFSLDEIAEIIERYFIMRIYGIPLPDLRNNAEPAVLNLSESGELFLFGVQFGKREADRIVLLQKDSIDAETLKNNINRYFATNFKRLIRLAERRYKDAAELLMNPEEQRGLEKALLLKILDDYKLRHRANQKGNAVAMNAFSIIEDFIRDELKVPLYSESQCFF